MESYVLTRVRSELGLLSFHFNRLWHHRRRGGSRGRHWSAPNSASALCHLAAALDDVLLAPWTAENADAEQRVAWLLRVASGMRRGELLALRWQDCDFDAGAISIRRSVGTVRSKGNPQQMVEGTPKNGNARVVDIDPATVAMLRAHRAGRAALDFTLARGESLIFGDINGGYRLPESFSRYIRETVARCIRDEVARDPLPTIHLHSLRHTAATLLLAAGVHPKVVQERLGHQTIGITLDVYSHALPTLQRDAADALGAIVHGGLSCGDVAIGSDGSLSRPSSPRG